MTKKRCAVLGATGSVGQRFTLLLEDHPQLELIALGASARSAGKPYKDVVTWKQTSPIPSNSAGIVVRECKAKHFEDLDLDLVFSALDSSVAGQRKRFPRLQLQLRRRRCRLPIVALQAEFGRVSDVEVFTEQALSGAGYPGVSTMDIVDNVIPYISGEEDKLEPEARKILGSLATVNDDDGDLTVKEHDTLNLDATCTRVGVSDGHMVYVSLRFERRPPPSAEQVKAALRNYTSEVQRLGCPSAPRRAIVVFEEADRPQPRLDRDLEGGFAVSVGRIRAGREDGHFDLRFVALSHNTTVGAAGSSILNAEAAIQKGLL
ncbi:hypothetical protein VTN00DRAFT_4438 [Thermoascus crustaceus]|uniref:uncharacterized protein n=1 Tax=Thermoascus crustaceus TaxID=5088 RepID=UPI0037440454